jgi:hypothetical protein
MHAGADDDDIPVGDEDMCADDVLFANPDMKDSDSEDEIGEEQPSGSGDKATRARPRSTEDLSAELESLQTEDRGVPRKRQRPNDESPDRAQLLTESAKQRIFRFQQVMDKPDVRKIISDLESDQKYKLRLQAGNHRQIRTGEQMTKAGGADIAEVYSPPRVAEVARERGMREGF